MRPILDSLPTPTRSTQGKPSRAQTNRQRFLTRVRSFWINGVLDHSLHGAALIALGLHEQLDALANPWHLVLQHPDTAPRLFPVGTRITEVYDAANGELLILGAPGSGKTTLLLELARDLLARAEQNESHLMPVVFPLSSWATTHQPLAEWMTEELITKYQVPRQLARTWIEEQQILPLLDGLDEVAPLLRTRCLDTINIYHQQHLFLPLVVSCRSADYIQQTGRVRLSSAVTIQPLTQQQVDASLSSGGEALWALRVALHQDASLRELAETPLMLSILTLTYHDMPVENLLKGGIAPTRTQIFERYVNRILVQRSGNTSYTLEQTKGWLSWLAKHLVQRGQTVFYLEQLQPNWLSSSRLLGWYDLLAVKVLSVFIGILVTVVINAFLYDLFSPYILLGGLVGWILSEESPPQRTVANSGKVRRISWQRLFQQLLIGLLIGLGLVLRGAPDNNFRHYFRPSDPLFLHFILLFGFYGFLLQVFLAKSNNIPSLSQTRSQGGRTKWQRLIRSPALYNGLFAGLGIGLIDYPLDGLIFGLSVVFLSQLLIGKSRTIQVTDRLIWSWSHLGQSLRSSQHIRATLQIIVLVVLLLGLLLGLLFAESIRQSTWLSNTLSYTLSYISIVLSVGLVVGLIYWLIIGLFQGVSSEIIEDQRRMTPNQGIHRSALNALVLGGISAMISGLILSLIVLLIERFFVQPTIGQGDWLIAGLSAGLLAGLFKGGLACLRHYVLRFLLWRNTSIPWNYSRFLDDAANHILLRKVGGGYIFVHRFLLEYFASLDTTALPDDT